LALTANEQLQDAVIRHQIGLYRYAGSVRNRVLALLDATERDLVEILQRRGVRLVGRDPRETVTQGRLKALLAEVRELRRRALTEAFGTLRDELKQLVVAEAEWAARAVQTVSPVQMSVTLPEPNTLRALVTHRPFEGAVLSQWAQTVTRSDVQRIYRAVQLGMVQGEPLPMITRRVVGTAAQRGANGLTQMTRNHLTTITRTAVHSMANAAQSQTWQENSDIFTHERFTATLDARTTPICRSEDGKIYKVGEGPTPPLHYNCRSVRVPVIDPKQAGFRPTRAATQRQLLREYAKANNLQGVRSRADLPRGHAGRFDSFSRTRVRELTGRTPASTNYQEFLGRQSRQFQDDVLGPNRAALFRRGGLTLDKFVDRATGRQYTLAELARREAEAFRRAGLDPDDFT
jgi:SPP1 gp7 family putative phage head morphogenesis protein